MRTIVPCHAFKEKNARGGLHTPNGSRHFFIKRLQVLFVCHSRDQQQWVCNHVSGPWLVQNFISNECAGKWRVGSGDGGEECAELIGKCCI